MASRKDNKGRVLQKGESQRTDGTYMYRYTDLFQHRQTIYAKTLKELRDKENELAARTYLNLSKESPTKLTVLALVDRFLALSAQKRKSTQRNYQIARNFIGRYPIGNMPVSKLTAGYFRTWMLTLCDEGYAVSTICNMARMIKMALNSAATDGVIIHNPVNIKFDFLPPANNRNALSKEELDSFMRFLESKPRYATYLDMTIVLVETGMRIGEFAGLTIDDIDFEHNLIHISKQLCGKSKNDLYVEKPKSKNGVRVLPMNSKVRKALEHIVSKTQQCSERRVIDGYSGFINIFEQGSLRHSTAYDDIYRKLCRRYQNTIGETIKVTPHILRHTFCTHHAQNGMTIPSLQYLMGHASPTTTLKTYTHTNQNIAHSEFYAMQA